MFGGIDALGSSDWLAIAAGATALAASLGAVVAWRDGRRAGGRGRRRAQDARARVLLADGRVIAANDAFAQLVGKARHEIVGRPVARFLPDLAALDPEAPEAAPTETRLFRPDGAVRRISVTARAGRRSKGDTGPAPLALIVAPLCEETGATGAEARVDFLARHDPLTGLPNLGEFLENAADLALATTEGGGRLAVIQVDLARFRAVNDVLGRRFGDQVLVEVARRLRAAAPTKAVVGRLAGDRYVIATPAIGPRAAVARQVERILLSTTGPIETPEALVEVSARASVALVDAPLAAVATLDDPSVADAEAVQEERVRDHNLGAAVIEQGLALADLAMNRAKGDSAARVVFYDVELDQSARDRGAIALALPRAMAFADRALDVHYQPQARIRAAASPTEALGPVVGYEALVRCSLPGRGRVDPGDLIPVAEETNAILAIGDWVLRHACADAAAWATPSRVAVNLSPVQLRHDAVLDMVADALAETRLDPARLELEITETAMIEDLDRAVRVMTALRELGVKLAIDDFGVGFSSLRTLKAFRFDLIKLDRIFVTDIEHDRETAAIVRAVVTLGQDLGMPVLAEGVETPEALTTLGRIGCSQVQGYLIGRPAPQDRFPALTGASPAPEAAPETRAAG